MMKPNRRQVLSFIAYKVPFGAQKKKIYRKREREKEKKQRKEAYRNIA